MFDVREYERIREDFLEKEQLKFTAVRKITKVLPEDKGVTLLCEGRNYKKGMMEPFFVQLDSALLPDGTSTSLAVKIELCTPAVFRLRLVEGEEVQPRKTPMVVNDFTEKVNYELVENQHEVKLKTSEIQIVITKEDCNLSVYDSAGRLLFKQYTEDRHSISHIVKEQSGDYVDSYSSFECYPFGIAEDPETGEKCATHAAVLNYDEHFYGFGEKFGPLDKKGQEVVLWQVDGLGVSTPKSYKNVPFFMSSRGYGIFINSSSKVKCQMGSYHYKTHSMLVNESSLDLYFIYGPSLKKILSRYTDITGKTPVPPKWSFGIWMSKNSYRSRKEVEEVASTLREKEIPCDVVHVDVDYFVQEWICDYEFDASRYPEPQEMIRRLNERGFKLSLWQLPYIKPQSKVYQEAAAKGYFAKNPDGTPAVKGADGIIDFSNPEAVEWYKNFLRRLLRLGVSVIKTDFGEGAVEEASYQGYAGKEMHNLYPLLYNQAAFEVTTEVNGEGIVWGRSAFAGSQRYPLNWGGDASTDFDGLYHSLRGGLSFGLSGFPFWSHDIGGYFCQPEKEVYVRWVQAGLFGSHARLHGTTPREPWVFGEEIEEIFKKYAKLRYRLMPYIYSTANHCCRESLPMLRAMVLEFEKDPTVYGIDDQFMFGESFLVAPILSFEHRRMVYLPGGSWVDYWSKEVLPGGQWIAYEAPLDKLPLFVRGGSIIPMGPDMNYVDEKPLDPVTVDIYPKGKSAFQMVDNKETIWFSCDRNGEGVYFNISTSDHNYELVFNNMAMPAFVECNGQQLPYLEGENTVSLAQGYYRDGEKLVVRVSSGNQPVSIRIC